MAVPQELANWVEEMKKAGLSPETLQALDKDLDRKEVADSFKRTVLAVADYSRQTQELARQRTEVEDYLGQLKQWKADREIDLRKNTAETNQYKQLATQAQAQLQAIQAAQEQLIRTGVVDASQIPVVTPTVAAEPAQSNGNGSGNYLTKEELNKVLEEKDNYYLGALGLVNDINREHYNLFGQWPDTKRLIEQSARTRKPLEEVWQNEYKVAEKRKELQDQAVQKQIEEGIAKGLTAARSEEAIKGNTFRQGDPSSPIQSVLAKDKERAEKNAPSGGFTGNPVFRPSHPEVASPATDAAIQAWREGRFRPNNNQSQ
jgi:uncharacterized protein YdbL (DUF1318 family)